MFCSIMKHVERKSVLVKACSRCLYWTIKKVQTLFRCFCFWHQGCQWTAAFITPTRPHPPAPLCCSAATASSPNQAALFTSPLTAFRFPSSLHLRPPTWPPSEARRLTHSDYFTYHVVVIKLVGVISCALWIYGDHPRILIGGNHFVIFLLKTGRYCFTFWLVWSAAWLSFIQSPTWDWKTSEGSGFRPSPPAAFGCFAS